jgi:hypothetical protein
MFDSSVAIDQSMSNLNDNEINDRPIPVFTEEEVDLVPDIEANALV